MMMKKIFSVVLALVFFSAFGFSAFASTSVVTSQSFPDGISFIGTGTIAGKVTDTLLSAACDGSSSTNSHVRSSEMIDLAEWDTITFTVSSRTANGNAYQYIGVNTIGAAYSLSDFSKNGGAGVKVTGEGDITIDISGVSGSCYIFMTAWGSTGASVVNVSKIVLSKTVEVTDPEPESDTGGGSGSDSGGSSTVVTTGNLLLDAPLEKLSVTEGLLLIIVMVLLLGLILRVFSR